MGLLLGSSSRSSSDSSSDMSVIIGASIGGFAFIVLSAIAIICIYRRQRAKPVTLTGGSAIQIIDGQDIGHQNPMLMKSETSRIPSQSKSETLNCTTNLATLQKASMAIGDTLSEKNLYTSTRSVSVLAQNEIKKSLYTPQKTRDILAK